MHHYITKEGLEKDILIFSNPDSKRQRERMCIKVSFDEGLSWPHCLLLDELSLKGGYSTLSSIDNSTIGIVYEGSQSQLAFERIKLSELGIFDALED